VKFKTRVVNYLPRLLAVHRTLNSTMYRVNYPSWKCFSKYSPMSKRGTKAVGRNQNKRRILISVNVKSRLKYALVTKLYSIVQLVEHPI